MQTLSHEYGAPVTINLAFSGSATDGDDYTYTGDSFTIDSGIADTIIIQSISDGVYEGNENIQVNISGITNATEDSPQQLALTITDDDIGFSPASGPVGTTVTIYGTGFNTTAANNIVFFWRHSG